MSLGGDAWFKRDTDSSSKRGSVRYQPTRSPTW